MDLLTAETLGDFSFTGQIATIIKIASTPQRALEMLSSANLFQTATVDAFLAKVEFIDDMDEPWWTEAQKRVVDGKLLIGHIEYDQCPDQPDDGMLHLFKDSNSTLNKEFSDEEALEEWVKEQVDENQNRVFYVLHYNHSATRFYLGPLVDSSKINRSCDGIFILPPDTEQTGIATALLQQFEDWVNGECYAAHTKTYDLSGDLTNEDSCYGFYGDEAAKVYLLDEMMPAH